MIAQGQYTIVDLYDGVQGPKGDTGPQGPKGDKGDTGVGVSSVVEHYLATTLSSGVTTGTSGWTTTVQTISSSKKYLWNYETINYTNGSSSMTTPVLIGTYGDKGDTGSTGAAGKSISSITEYYLASTSSSGVTTATSGWTTTMQATTTSKKYLWNYELITYTDGSTTTINPVIIGTHGATGPKGDTGPQGPQGIQGPKGVDGTSQYVHIRYSAASNGNPMTTTPQSNTAYIGIAVTTSATAPTGYTSYTWSLYKGPKGDTGGQGIQGPPGVDGTTTYTWVKYADDNLGGNMADSPAGKRYIGLAFNKTTQTESTSASDYQWSPLYDNVQVGGRNLIKKSDEFNGVNGATGITGSLTEEGYLQTVTVSNNANYQTGWAKDISGIEDNFIDGDPFTISFTIKRVSGTGKPTIHIKSGMGYYNLSGDLGTDFTTLYYSGTWKKANSIAPHLGWSGTAGTFIIKNWKIEKGNIATDWTPAPEDVQDQINDKAETSDLDNLAEILSSVSSELNFKAGMGEFQALEEAFNERIAQDISDKEQLAADLATLEGRTTLIETLAGDNKLVTQFIETVITESEEGIFIGNSTNRTGLLLSDARISFLDNDTEVAYISNKTMEITHGIFVETATISNFKFEKIPGTTILGITWVD